MLNKSIRLAEKIYDYRTLLILDENQKSWLWRSAGCLLRAQGRIIEGFNSMRHGLESGTRDNAEAAGYLCKMSLLLGRFSDTLAFAEQAVTLSDEGFHTKTREQPYWQIVARTQKAHVLHVMGKSVAAELFIEAESRKQEYDSAHPLLNSIPGFYYCSFLMDRALDAVRYRNRQEAEELSRRVKERVDTIVGTKNWLPLAETLFSNPESTDLLDTVL